MESEDMSRSSLKSTTIEDPLLQTELLVTSSDFQVEAPPAEPAVSSKLLAIYATLLLVAGVGNAIYYKKMTNHVQNCMMLFDFLWFALPELKLFVAFDRSVFSEPSDNRSVFARVWFRGLV
jgi:hypothetical protein